MEANVPFPIDEDVLTFFNFGRSHSRAFLSVRGLKMLIVLFSIRK